MFLGLLFENGKKSFYFYKLNISHRFHFRRTSTSLRFFILISKHDNDLLKGRLSIEMEE